MKTSIKFTLLSLTVMSCVRCEEITVRGHEGGDAVLNCPYQKGDESIKKYLLKGESKDGVDVILSRKGKVWTHKERVSLQDKKDVNIFTVTIRNLTPEDAGIYWCGVKKYLEDTYTRVNLIVDRKANKPTAAIPTVNAEVTTVTLPNTIPAVISKLTAKVTTVTPPNTPDRKDNKPTAVTADVTIVTLPNTPGHLLYYIYVIVMAALGLLGLLIMTFILMKNRARNRADRPLRPLSSARQSREQNSVNEKDPQDSNTTQSLNPNTTQPDAVYQSLNPNTTQPDAVYQSLNPNAIQPDAVYQSLVSRIGQ